MMRFAKRALPLLLAALLLAACSRAPDTEPVCRLELPHDCTVLISNCTLLEEAQTGFAWIPGEEAVECPFFKVEGTPLLTFEGLTESNVDICFAEPCESGYQSYLYHMPTELLDYVPLPADDGTPRYRLDTRYSYMIISGNTIWIIDCALD